MNTDAFHFVIVEKPNASLTQGVEDTRLYGPYPTRQAAAAVLERHPCDSEMQIVGLGRLAPIVDLYACHPNSAGV